MRYTRLPNIDNLVFYLCIPAGVLALYQWLNNRKEERDRQKNREADYQRDRLLLIKEPGKWYDAGYRVISREQRDMQLAYDPSEHEYPSPRASNYY